MSVDINWETLTSGEDGARLAETIRDFIHNKFQQVPLPRFVQSIQVHSFEFGDAIPSVEVKDISDPLPDFYEDEDEEDEEDEVDDDNDDPQAGEQQAPPNHQLVPEPVPFQSRTANWETSGKKSTEHHVFPTENPLSPRLLGPQPAIPGATSNLSYFHLPFAPGLSGSTTPLAAVASGRFQPGWSEQADMQNIGHAQRKSHHHHSASASSITPPSSLDPTSRPSSQHRHDSVPSNPASDASLGFDSAPGARVARDRSPNDLQVVARVKYFGNVKLSLTAEILLDYPTPSFVGIPLQLQITGLNFDGVAILAYIKRKAHFCFLSPEDAETFLGYEGTSGQEDGESSTTHPPRAGGLLEEIRVESEIGQRESGKQVLKNVGRVERFILEQVRRIFEDEFVYPSFWTFLV
jgi:distribution and morphology protein 12